MGSLADLHAMHREISCLHKHTTTLHNLAEVMQQTFVPLQLQLEKLLTRQGMQREMLAWTELCCEQSTDWQVEEMWNPVGAKLTFSTRRTFVADNLNVTIKASGQACP